MGSPPVFDGVHVPHLFSFLCCVVFCLSYVLNTASVSGLSILDFAFGFL